jgi:phosphoribosylaminoimidazole carboxylase PurE protein
VSAPLAIIILGSKSDLEHGRAIARSLEGFGVEAIIRIASAHKVTGYLLDLLAEYERSGRPRVYVTVAGRSNALSGVVDANVAAPVIACPPYSDRFGGLDILSSLRMPGGVAPLVVLEPEAAGLAAAKMLALASPALGERVAAYQARLRQQAVEDDRAVREG